MIEFHKGNIHKARSRTLCIIQESITDMVGLLFFTLLCVLSSVFAEVLWVKHGSFCITGSCPVWLHLVKFTLKSYTTSSNYMRAICSSLKTPGEWVTF